MSKPNPDRVIPQLLEAAINTGKDRASLYSEYIRIHWRTTGKLAPGCDAKDFYAAFDERSRRTQRALDACPACDGRGVFGVLGRSCAECDGTGKRQ